MTLLSLPIGHRAPSPAAQLGEDPAPHRGRALLYLCLAVRRAPAPVVVLFGLICEGLVQIDGVFLNAGIDCASAQLAALSRLDLTQAHQVVACATTL